MKNKLLYIGIFILPFLSNGQSQALEISESIITSTLPEWQAWKAIRKDQEAVKEASKDISFKSAAILALKTAEVEALRNPPERIRETTSWKDSYTLLSNIVSLNGQSVQLIEAYPNIFDYPMETFLLITQQTHDQIILMEQIYEGGKENMMKSTDRYELITKINHKLITIYQLSYALRDLLRVQFYSYKLREPVLIDYQEPIRKTFEEIDGLFEPLN